MEFISGMAGEEGRSRRLGDVASSAPSEWRWGAKQEPDVLLMLYAREGDRGVAPANRNIELQSGL